MLLPEINAFVFGAQAHIAAHDSLAKGEPPSAIAKNYTVLVANLILLGSRSRIGR